MGWAAAGGADAGPLLPRSGDTLSTNRNLYLTKCGHSLFWTAQTETVPTKRYTLLPCQHHRKPTHDKVSTLNARCAPSIHPPS